MTSFERLVASDPARDAPYETRELDAMLARVVSTAYPHVTSWRAFKARVLAALGASGAVMAVAISLIAGAGPSLAPLSFAAAPIVPSAATNMSTLEITSTGVANAPTRYVASTLSAQAPSLAAYGVSAPAEGPRVFALVARALARRVGPVSRGATRSGGGTTWTARGEAFSSLTLERVGGVDFWNFSFPPNTLVAGGTYGPSRSSLERWALKVVNQLGGEETGVPVYSSGLTSRVVVPLLIAGHSTNLADTFTFDSLGHVVAASGVIFTLGPPVAYPLVSPRAAASQVATQMSLFSHAVSTQGWVGYAPLGTATAHGGPGGDVHLETSSLQYRVVVDAHGTAHAIPIYLYRGSGGDSAPVVVEATAIDPRYISYEVHGSSLP